MLARELLAMSREQFSAPFKGSQMKRATLRGLRRNAAVLLGNNGGAEDIDVRRRALDDPEPNGCECHAVRALGWNVTALPTPRAGVFARNSGSVRTVPVNHSAGAFADGRDSLRLIFIELSPRFWMVPHAAFARRLILDRAASASGGRNKVRRGRLATHHVNAA